MRLTFFSLFLLFTSLNLHAQERCGTVRNMDILRSRGNFPKDPLLFENWLQQKLKSPRTKNQRAQAGPYQVPVVVHVIHNGENEGSGTNISDAQILSQIKVLNQDFQRLNADASQTPAEFNGVAGSMDIEFVLAKQDPEGLPSDGIVRVQGAKDGWTANDNYELKAQSYWPAEDYLNIWVCDLVDNLVGYAQLPESGEPGHENSSVNRMTDGVVIWYRAFGSVDDGAFNLSTNFNKGRTATHEVGHYFGLNHIWGDDSGGCSGSDYVDDTPNQASNSSGCPSHPRNTCSTVNMFQNFMDYTNDICMNLFTTGQVGRMQIVIENSPRRASLLTSHGLTTPNVNALDAGINAIVNRGDFICNSNIQPTIRLRNYGTNVITTVQVRFSVNGVPTETKLFNVNLQPLEEEEVSFAAFARPAGNYNIEFSILQVNGGADPNAFNNVLAESIIVPVTVEPPFTETFTSAPLNWTIENPDGKDTWEITTAPRESATNKALYVNIYDYTESQGELDIFLSPLIDLSNAPVAALEFFVSHAKYPNSNDRLRVVIMEGCEELADGTILYEKGGDNLKTILQSVSEPFFPTSDAEWRREFIDLSSYIGPEKIRLAFVVISDWGNNIFLDNISLVTEEFDDVSLVGLDKVPVVSCNENFDGVLQVENVGTSIIESVRVIVTLNGDEIEDLTYLDLNLLRGQIAELSLPPVTFEEGLNEIEYQVTEPNGGIDPTAANNSKLYHLVVNKSEEKIPLRENFESDFTDQWTIVNPSGGRNWETTVSTYGNALFYNAFSNTTLGDQAWLVSPVLDFSSTTAASLVFDIAQRSRNGKQEDVTVYASTDCGEEYYPIYPVELDTKISVGPFKPAQDSDWFQNFVVDLTDLAGESAVRIALVVTNENANNVYIDNIEFFTASPPNLTSVDIPFAVYGYNASNPILSQLKITFNLEERQDVQLLVSDMAGRVYTRQTLTDILNQTYPIEFNSKPSRGVYILQLIIGGKKFVQKIVVYA